MIFTSSFSFMNSEYLSIKCVPAGLFSKESSSDKQASINEIEVLSCVVVVCGHESLVTLRVFTGKSMKEKIILPKENDEFALIEVIMLLSIE